MMGRMGRKCIEQFGERVYSTLWELAERHGIPRNADTVRKFGLLHEASYDLVGEEKGMAPEFHRTDEEIAEIEATGVEFKSLAMAFLMLRDGMASLEVGDLEGAQDMMMVSLTMAGFGLGMAGIHLNVEITRRARKANAARHVPTYAKQEEIRQYWLDNIDRQMKNVDAADILFKVFDLEHRTLARYVARFKKELLAKK